MLCEKMKHRYPLKKQTQDLPRKTSRYRQKQRHRDYHYRTQRKQRLHRHTPTHPSSIKSTIEKKRRRFPTGSRWMKYFLGLTCCFSGGFWFHDQLTFSVVESHDALKLQVNHPWVQDRTFQLWWGDELLTEEVLPASSRSYLAFPKEFVAKQDETRPFVPVIPTVQETETTIKLSWEPAQPQTTCQQLKISTWNDLLSEQEDYCVTVPIHHYELRKGTQLIAVTQDLEFNLEKTTLEGGVHEYEWVAVNENGIEVVEPISFEYYPFEITETYQLTNPTPYSNLTYEVQKDEEWLVMESTDITPYLTDTQSPELTDMEVTPYSRARQLYVSVEGKDVEETLIYHFRIHQENAEFYPTLQTTYESGIDYYEAGIGEVGKNPIQSKNGTFTFSSLAPGTYQVWVRAVDCQGNVSDVWTREATIQEVTMVSSTTNTTSSNSTSHTNQSTTSQSTGSSSNNSSVSSSSSSSSRPTDQKANWLFEMTTCYQGVSTETCDSILTAVHRVIPKHVVQTLYTNGATIDIMPNTIREIVRNLTGWDAGWNYHGVTFYNSHGQSNHIFTSVKGGRNIFIHEMGHLYDYFKGMLSSTDEFVALYQAEKGIFTGLYASSSVEFFAETFRMYITEPSTLSSKAPKTYTYMKQLVG